LGNSKKYNNITKILTDQKINIVFSLVCLINKPRNWNRRNIDNYLEIFIDCDLKKIIKKNKKKTYKNNKNIVGIDIKPEFPKNPDIVIKNDFSTNTNLLAKQLIKKISNFY
jgi:adenylylsulfate kinase-like enzyme